MGVASRGRIKTVDTTEEALQKEVIWEPAEIEVRQINE